MSEDVFFTYAKSHYFAEFDRKKDLNSVTTISTGIASVIGAAIYALAFKLPVISSTMGAICFTGLAVAALAFVTGVVQLIRAHVGHEYKYTGSMDGIVESRTKAEEQDYSPQQLSAATGLLILDQYVESVAFNERTNDLKSAYLHRANVALVWSVSILFFVGALTVVSHVYTEVQKVELMSDGDNQPKPTEQQEAPVRLPDPPPTRVIKENEIPREQRN